MLSSDEVLDGRREWDYPFVEMTLLPQEGVQVKKGRGIKKDRR